MESIVLKAIINRYNNLATLYQYMLECEDTVLINLCDDINDIYTDKEVLFMIQKTL